MNLDSAPRITSGTHTISSSSAGHHAELLKPLSNFDRKELNQPLSHCDRNTLSSFALFYLFFSRFPGVCAVGGFCLVNLHSPVPVELESGARARWVRHGQGRQGRTGDGARELLPWTAGPGTQKNFVPKDPLARDSKGRRFALSYISRLIRVVLCPRTTYHSPIVPAAPSLPARTRALAMKCFLG
jgi:hypothetical protein